MHPFADRTNITKEEIHQLPISGFQGKVFVVDTKAGVHHVIEEIKYEKVLGFDTETKPNFKKGQSHKVALLQLATPSKAWLFRLHHTGLPEELIHIFNNADILKCGVAIRDDLKALQRIHHFIPGGFIELGVLAKSKGLEVEGLRKLAAILLGIRVSKGAQTTNWEAGTLTSKQIDYAATDAWVCFEIYNRLIGRE